MAARIKIIIPVAIIAFCAVLVFTVTDCIKKHYEFPFQDPSLGIEERVDDLVGRMTLEEKISQMMNSAPAVERLGIPEYDWWNECLHGVARAGLGTVFPQAIGLGATWDEDMMFRVSTAISDEARAKHHDFVRDGKRHIYQGLTFWSPNINIFRDPRWGRGQETYGEDPFLTGRMAVQFIRGLQGDDPKYFKTIATIKHYAVHSGPEPVRHSFDAVTNERDFRETYLPQFEMGIKEGKAYSVMCAYNRYKGEACCGSNRMLNTILRDEWGFDGYVVSDCGAIYDIYMGHQLVSTPKEAAALAVKSGCDLECANVFTHLKEAVDTGLITEQEIDVALKRLFTARIRLGMFDPPEMVPYTKIPYERVDCPEHRELALEAARKSIVLLKNKNNLLPLRKDIGTVAVIGPNADEWLMLLGNYNGIPSDPVTPLRGIREKLGEGSKVLYAQGCEPVREIPLFVPVPSYVLYHGEKKSGLEVEYFSSKDLNGQVILTSADSILDVNWIKNSPPADLDENDFGIRWSGELVPDQSGTYQLGFFTTCKVNLYLEDSLLINTTGFPIQYLGEPRLLPSSPVELVAGKRYRIRIETNESYGDTRIQMVWALSGQKHQQELKNQALETARQSDVVIMCMGLTPWLEGEEMYVKADGFHGGDRTHLDLPDVQQELIRDIHALGKPVVLVLLNGSALSINRENEQIPAILEAWYTGQEAGRAIADVIFGDYNPGGRLPVTFYKSVNDLPPFEEYRMTGQTYRYFRGKPLYPFGYGLSYTTFSYSNLKAGEEFGQGDTVSVTLNVKNTGAMAGDEVVQVYLTNLDAKVPVPLRALVAFRRIHLMPGEEKIVGFQISPDAFTITDDSGEKGFQPGRYDIFAGGGQPGTGTEILNARITIK
jgi:beta-glucosidase